MTFSPLRANKQILVSFNMDEIAWIEQLAQRLQVKKTVLVRMGLCEIARSLGMESGVRVRPQQSWDRDDKSRRAYADRAELLRRRMAGEWPSSIAAEYGATVPAVCSAITIAAREAGLTLHQAIRADVKQMAERVLTDPFLPITERDKEIIDAIITHPTYQEAGEALGITRQRIDQVATKVRRLCGALDGRRANRGKPRPRQITDIAEPLR